jgi:hypothetical protein
MCELVCDPFWFGLSLEVAPANFFSWLRHCFDTLVALITWEVWKERNARVFRGDARHVDQLLQHIKAVADLWVQGGAVGLGCIMRE